MDQGGHSQRFLELSTVVRCLVMLQRPGTWLRQGLASCCCRAPSQALHSVSKSRLLLINMLWLG